MAYRINFILIDFVWMLNLFQLRAMWNSPRQSYELKKNDSNKNESLFSIFQSHISSQSSNFVPLYWVYAKVLFWICFRIFSHLLHSKRICSFILYTITHIECTPTTTITEFWSAFFILDDSLSASTCAYSNMNLVMIMC